MADPFPARDQATLDFYGREAVAYAASSQGRTSRWLIGFMQALPAGARVLELGCGGGADAEAMLSRGFDVDATDGTPAMAAEAERRLGRRVRVMPFDQLADSDAYDAIWANASLLHVPGDSLPKILALIFAALKPGGLHFATYKSGAGGGHDALGRFFNYPSRLMLADCYSTAGPWQAVSMTDYISGGYEGGDVPWIAVSARKPMAAPQA